MTTTTTILNTGRLFNALSPRMKPKFWEGLDEPTKQSCVGGLMQRSYDGKAAWEAAGRLLEFWDTTVHTSLKSAFSGNLQEKIYIGDDQNEAVTVSFELCLLGRAGLPATSKPSILVVCVNPRISSRTINLLKKHPKIKELRLGFNFVAQRDRIIILASDSDSGLTSISKMMHEVSFKTACGSHIISTPVPVHPGSDGKRSILGGILLLGGHYYGLTVAHTLLRDFGNNDATYNSSDDGSVFSEQESEEDESVSEDECSQEDESLEEDNFATPLAVAYASTISAVYLENQNRPNLDPASVINDSFVSQDTTSNISLVGHTDATSRETGNADSTQESRWFSLESDWALIEIQDSRLMLPNTFVVNEESYTVRSFCTKGNRSEGGLVVLRGDKEKLHVANPATLAGISLPWLRRFVDVWIMEFPSVRGDCGTWVVDAQSGSFFGVVVASSADSKSTYVLPAEDIIDSIYARWKDCVTNSSDIFPTVAASSDNIQTFELSTHHDFDFLDGERVITGLYLPALGEFRDFEDQYKQFDQADTESTRSSSISPTDVFDPPYRGAYASSMSSSISHAQSARYDGRAIHGPDRSVRGEMGEVPLSMKSSEQDLERERSMSLIKQQDVELRAGRETIKTREAEIKTQKIENRKEVERLQQQVRRLQEMLAPQQSSYQLRPQTRVLSEHETRPEAVPEERQVATRHSSDSRHQPTTKETKLSPLAHRFAQIGRRQFANCRSYIIAHPRILDEPHNEYLREADLALQSDDIEYAKQCIERAIITRESGANASGQSRSYLPALMKNREPEASEFAEDCETVFRKLKQNSSTRFAAAYPSRTDVSTPVRHHQGAIGAGLTSLSPYPPRSEARTRSDGAHSTRAVHGDMSIEEALDPRYRVHSRADSFFTVGCVFATLWHSSLSTDDPASTRHRGPMIRGNFGEKIISWIQRFVVVRKGHGFCWCISVSTYMGKGVAKRAFNKSDRAAHAIICMKGQSPRQAEDEDGMSKKPIYVVPASPDQTLDPMSRLNFGKVYTLEHNIKVMPVGKVDQTSLTDFEQYWEETVMSPFMRKRGARAIADENAI